MSESDPKIEPEARSLRVCIAAYKDFGSETVNSLMQLRNQLPFVLDMIGVAEVAVARAMLAARVQKEDFVLWIDSDMVFAPQHFHMLHEALEKDPEMGLISALAVRRDGSNAFCVNWREGKVGWKTIDHVQERCLRYIEDEENPIHPVDVTGLAFTLMRRDCFDKIKAPLFQPAWLPDTENEGKYLFFGEDSSFMKKLQVAGYRPSVHFGCHVGHVGNKIYAPPPPKRVIEEMKNDAGSPNENEDPTPDGSPDPSG
jgi:hypothetical protein